MPHWKSPYQNLSAVECSTEIFIIYLSSKFVVYEP